ncbi:hypothetical protein J6590_051495 [Homalodisca vitripennis]|nr:hypothetical protein J6590_051495 [Homalodisca vitripennis]
MERIFHGVSVCHVEDSETVERILNSRRTAIDYGSVVAAGVDTVSRGGGGVAMGLPCPGQRHPDRVARTCLVLLLAMIGVKELVDIIDI